MKSRLILPFLALSVCVLSGLTCPEDCETTDPNPAVDRIDITVLTADPARIRVTGVVENKGGGTFDSSAGQQSVQLYQGLDTTPLATQTFEDLAPGATVSVTHEMDWSRSTEFPPTLRVVIAYDPDIFIDGNDNNDDCSTSDNVMEKTGSEINAEF